MSQSTPNEYDNNFEDEFDDDLDEFENDEA